MILVAENLELRGCEKKVSSKTGKPYLTFFLEEESGNPCKFVCRDENVYRSDMKKGQVYRGIFEYNSFGNLNLVDLVNADGN